MSDTTNTPAKDPEKLVRLLLWGRQLLQELLDDAQAKADRPQVPGAGDYE